MKGHLPIVKTQLLTSPHPGDRMKLKTPRKPRSTAEKCIGQTFLLTARFVHPPLRPPRPSRDGQYSFCRRRDTKRISALKPLTVWILPRRLAADNRERDLQSRLVSVRFSMRQNRLRWRFGNRNFVGPAPHPRPPPENREDHIKHSNHLERRFFA